MEPVSVTGFILKWRHKNAANSKSAAHGVTLLTRCSRVAWLVRA